MTIIHIFITIVCAIAISTGLMVLGAYLATKLISKGMVASGNAPIIGNTSGDAFSISDGIEQFPGTGEDEKNIKEMADQVLKSFGKMGGA